MVIGLSSIIWSNKTYNQHRFQRRRNKKRLFELELKRDLVLDQEADKIEIKTLKNKKIKTIRIYWESD